MRVSNQDTGRFLMRPKNSDGLTALNQEGLVVLEAAESLDDLGVAFPIAGRFPRPPVDNQLRGVLGYVRIEVVHQHPERCFLVPALAGQGGSGRSSDDVGRDLDGWHG